MSGGDTATVGHVKDYAAVSAYLAIFMLSLILIWRAWPHQIPVAGDRSVSSADLFVSDAPAIGSRQARVALVEFSDFYCPYCARFATDVLPELRRRYVDTGRVLLIFRHFPLEEIHPDARRAGAIAACAGAQNRFWEMHDALFGGLRGREGAGFVAATESLGINLQTFEICVKKQADNDVSRDLAIGNSMGVTGTPTFLVGPISAEGRLVKPTLVVGMKSLEVLAKTIDPLLR